MESPAKSWTFVAVWQFRPKHGSEQPFLNAYGPKGIWARFFADGEGFLGTKLNRDLKDQDRYLTLDFWASKAAYDHFRQTHQAEYSRIDAQCEALTQEEKLIGYFERIRQSNGVARDIARFLVIASLD
jgi:heme-degrading monooxygenase HmoA